VPRLCVTNDCSELSIRTHMKQPPHSIITDHRAHVHKMEGGSHWDSDSDSESCL
jgi:hypothetical protein